MVMNKVFSICIYLIFAFSDITYAESQECESAKSDAESYAYDLESIAKKLRQCASNEGAGDLEYRAKKLQSCAGYSDFTDDCYSEFQKVKREHLDEVCYGDYRRVKSAFSYYESAVSEVSSYCD